MSAACEVKKRVKPTCPECGSDKIYSEDNIYWDIETQSWQISDNCMDCWCGECHLREIDRNSIVWVEVPLEIEYLLRWQEDEHYVGFKDWDDVRAAFVDVHGDPLSMKNPEWLIYAGHVQSPINPLINHLAIIYRQDALWYLTSAAFLTGEKQKPRFEPHGFRSEGMLVNKLLAYPFTLHMEHMPYVYARIAALSSHLSRL